MCLALVRRKIVAKRLMEIGQAQRQAAHGMTSAFTTQDAPKHITPLTFDAVQELQEVQRKPHAATARSPVKVTASKRQVKDGNGHRAPQALHQRLEKEAQGDRRPFSLIRRAMLERMPSHFLVPKRAKPFVPPRTWISMEQALHAMRGGRQSFWDLLQALPALMRMPLTCAPPSIGTQTGPLGSTAPHPNGNERLPLFAVRGLPTI